VRASGAQPSGSPDERNKPLNAEEHNMINHFADKIVDAANTMAAGGTYGCVNDYDAYQPDLEDARETDPNILAVLNAAKDPKLNPPRSSATAGVI
jgi:hypothetical protein